MITLTSRVRKRVIPAKSSCPNPLFERWLEEWRKEAADRNSDLQYCYGKALQSLRRYPLKLHSGKECLILKNFGSQLAIKLDRKLAEYRKIHPDEIITNDSTGSRSMPVAASFDAPAVVDLPPKIQKPTKRKKTGQPKGGVCASASGTSKKNEKAYVPAPHSGSHAILCTMLKEQDHISHPGFMTKAEIMNKAAELCSSSFTRSDSGNHYTAWNSMSTLIKKGLVLKHGNPAKYTLTEEGEALARTLLMDSNIQTGGSVHSNHSHHSSQSSTPNERGASPSCHASPSSYSSCGSTNFTNILSTDFLYNLPQEDNDICLMDDVPAIMDAISEQNSPPLEKIDDFNSNDLYDSNTDQQLIFSPGNFNIFLLVDTMETTGNRGKQVTQETIQELTRLKTNFEVRHLKVGDFAWVARNRENKEVLLPYIVERKRMDDLGKSIKDERFHEQKFRLRQCGLDNVIYLVEKFGSEARLGLPINTLHQAIINSQVVDNFFIKTTNNHKQSMCYLSALTKLLTNIFKDKILLSCPRNGLPPFDIDAELVSLLTFEEFSKFSMKNKDLKVRDMFMKQLLQLKGCSVEKASVIVEKYPTPRLLKQAFKSSSKPETMLANLTCGALNRNIGPILSKSIHSLYISGTLM